MALLDDRHHDNLPCRVPDIASAARSQTIVAADTADEHAAVTVPIYPLGIGVLTHRALVPRLSLLLVEPRMIAVSLLAGNVDGLLSRIRCWLGGCRASCALLPGRSWCNAGLDLLPGREEAGFFPERAGAGPPLGAAAVAEFVSADTTGSM